MEEFIISTDIELADIQQTIAVLNEKLNHWKMNYPYATYEINKMETALEVLNDLESDISNMEE